MIVDEDYYEEICMQADALGMESLTEEQQYIIMKGNDEKDIDGTFNIILDSIASKCK